MQMRGQAIPLGRLEKKFERIKGVFNLRNNYGKLFDEALADLNQKIGTYLQTLNIVQ